MDAKERIYDNTRALSKIKRIPMAEIERKIDVSAGYLSRIKNIGIEKIMQIARILDVSIDELVNGDYRKDFRKEIAEAELTMAVEKAMNELNGIEILDVVNRVKLNNIGGNNS